MPEPRVGSVVTAGRPHGTPPAATTWTRQDRTVGRLACQAVCVLSLAYIPTMLAGFLASGGLDVPVAGPYLAIMELLIMLLAIPLVLVHQRARLRRRGPKESRTRRPGARLAVSRVHLVLLTVGRQSDAQSLPGYELLLSWNWPSVVFALDIAAWDFFLGFALLLAAPVFAGPGLSLVVRRGLQLSGGLCIFGLVGAATGSMGVRDIGIVGYGVVLPLVLLLVARLFGNAPTDQAGR